MQPRSFLTWRCSRQPLCGLRPLRGRFYLARLQLSLSVSQPQST